MTEEKDYINPYRGESAYYDKNKELSPTTIRRSLYVMDQEVFDGVLEKNVRHLENRYINITQYDSSKALNFYWNKQYKCLPARRITGLLSMRYQDKLKKMYEENIITPKEYIACKCESCENYVPFFKNSSDTKENYRCPICDKYIVHSNSLYNWMRDNSRIKMMLKKEKVELEEDSFKNINQNDKETKIQYFKEDKIFYTTAYEVTHGMLDYINV